MSRTYYSTLLYSFDTLVAGFCTYCPPSPNRRTTGGLLGKHRTIKRLMALACEEEISL
jgi:hypothetical protein